MKFNISAIYVNSRISIRNKILNETTIFQAASFLKSNREFTIFEELLKKEKTYFLARFLKKGLYCKNYAHTFDYYKSSDAEVWPLICVVFL